MSGGGGGGEGVLVFLGGTALVSHAKCVSGVTRIVEPRTGWADISTIHHRILGSDEPCRLGN